MFEISVAGVCFTPGPDVGGGTDVGVTGEVTEEPEGGPETAGCGTAGEGYAGFDYAAGEAELGRGGGGLTVQEG